MSKCLTQSMKKNINLVVISGGGKGVNGRS